jgi:hypothetical protein
MDGTKQDMRPLKLEVKNGIFTIEIGVDVLARAAQWKLDEEYFHLSNKENEPSPSRIVDNVGFAKALIRQLNKEGDRDGSTPLTRLIDTMTLEVFESGDESISCPDD